MTANEPVGASPRPPLQRSRRNRIVGGVCAGIAEHLGVDSVLVRILAVLLGVVSGGAAVLAYLIAWVVIPQADDEPAPPPPQRARAAGDGGGARDAWRSVGAELRGLADGLRTGGPASARGPDPTPPDAGRQQGWQQSTQPGQQQPARRPVEAVDAAMTALGERLRDPEVQAGARRAATGFSAAVTASIDELGRRSRRAEPTPPGADENRTDQG